MVEPVEGEFPVVLQSELIANETTPMIVQGPARRRRAGGAAGLGEPRCRRPARGAGPHHQGQRAADGVGDRPHRRGARGHRDDDQLVSRRRPHRGRLRPGSRQAAADRQGDRLRLVGDALGSGVARPGLGGAGGRQAHRLRGPARRAARVPRRLLGPRRRRDRGRPGAAAGDPVRALAHAAGRRPRRAARDRRQGPDRPRLRRPHVLGHRDVRAAGAHLHRAARRRRRAALAPADARPGARARP